MESNELPMPDISDTESAYRRGVAHGIEAAKKVISGPNKTRDYAFQELEDFAQVVCDWRSGQTEINGWSGEPWHWSKESYQNYLDRFKETW